MHGKMHDGIRSSERKLTFLRASFVEVMLQDVLNEADEINLDMAAMTRKLHRFCAKLDCHKEFHILKVQVQ